MDFLIKVLSFDLDINSKCRKAPPITYGESRLIGCCRKSICCALGMMLFFFFFACVCISAALQGNLPFFHYAEKPHLLLL